MPFVLSCTFLLNQWGQSAAGDVKLVKMDYLPQLLQEFFVLKNLSVAYLLKIMDFSRFRDGNQFLLLTSFSLMQHGENKICSYCLMCLAEESVYEPWNQILEHRFLGNWGIGIFQSLHIIFKFIC